MQHSMILAELTSFDHWIVPILMMKDSLLKRRHQYRGHYSVHFHRNGVERSGLPAVVRGSVVRQSRLGFCQPLSYVDFIDNVAFDVGAPPSALKRVMKSTFSG